MKKIGIFVFAVIILAFLWRMGGGEMPVDDLSSLSIEALEQRVQKYDDEKGMYELAYRYRDNADMRDYDKAFYWYEKSAQKGYPEGMTGLGRAYRFGEGTPQDYVKAREWYEKGIAAGDATAFNNLGVLYHKGLGVKQDYARAAELYNQAIDLNQGSSSYNNLALLYDYGLGVKKDLKRAVSLYISATNENKDEIAAYNLANLYEDEFGDRQKALVWYRKASDWGSEDARKRLKKLDALDSGDEKTEQPE